MVAALPTFVPALKPPPNTVSNTDHPASLAGLATLTIAICIPLVTIPFVLRSYVRFWLKRVFIFEDVLCILLWAGTIAYCGIMRATMSHGGGMHMWDISLRQSHDAAYWFNVCAIEYGVMIGLAKIAVLYLYRRVFSPLKRSALDGRRSAFDVTIVTLIVVIFLFYAITSMVKIFECWPRNKIWDRSLPGKCVQIKWILNLSGGFNTLTDWMILLLPIHAVSRLQMDKLKKVLVVLAFTFGMCAPIFATVGFAVRIRNSGNKDVSWKQPEILLWGAGELASSNLILCFPELAAVFRPGAWKKQSTRRRPGPSTLKGWSEPRSSKKVASDPYMTKSLITATLTGSDGQYIQLDDMHKVQISGTSSLRDQQQTGEGVVVRKDVMVETHSIV